MSGCDLSSAFQVLHIYLKFWLEGGNCEVCSDEEWGFLE